MRNIKIIIEYDGTKFNGWQSQPNCRTVQGVLERAINKLTDENIKIIGAGRTDGGVHAKGQAANFITNSSIPGDRFFMALNSVLPNDISIVNSEEVDLDFHSRYNAKGKIYEYIIYNSRIRSPIYRNYSWHVPLKLDIKSMRSALKYFKGTHDFRGFMSSGSNVKDTVRTIYDIEISSFAKFIKVKISGNGFLYNMVRIIIGTLVDVGQKNIYVEDIKDIIKSKQRENAGKTAKPQGLYLKEVFY
ncbi:tRNA pseudouridine(38-40) synthase TruA [Clostridiisalibacter paucivorans]|uniref:tRNA pseudouridine(38-40) synthase TruA n=1 Tax=Clostridiisalibacter paucivorans TaxID=408753 RepID=UPI00047CBD84|nr:tRNA pseudouridine(38-40) synthase TruA [Clostridiisalibacter paucivorans]